MDDINDRLVPVYQQLQKSFSILRKCNVTFKETTEECQGEVNSIQNLAEQYTCCEEADVDALLLHLPDIREKLLYSISKDIDKKLIKLKNFVAKFKEIHERIAKQYSYSLEAAKQLPLDFVTIATETIPAVSQMVEWLKDMDFLIHNHYCSKKYLIDTFDIHKVESNDFVKKWTLGNKDAAQKMNEWSSDIFNNNVNRKSKLRMYRLYKDNVKVEPYVRLNIPKNQRRYMAMFRAGSLPLALETGRYFRPPIPVEQRLCKYCDLSDVESEKHFLMVCPLYSDLRFDLFNECSKYVDGFDVLNIDEKFITMMHCKNIQQFLCKSLYKFYVRRKLFTFE